MIMSWSCLTVVFHSNNHQFICLTSVIIVLWCNMACWQNNSEATDLSWHLKCQPPDSSSVTMQVILIFTMAIITIIFGNHLCLISLSFSLLGPLPLNNSWRILSLRTQEPGRTLRSFKIWNHWHMLNQCQSEDECNEGNVHTIIISHFLFQNKLLKEQKLKSDK